MGETLSPTPSLGTPLYIWCPELVSNQHPRDFQSRAADLISYQGIFGANDETRTHTVFQPRDFKSLVSTISPHWHIFILGGEYKTRTCACISAWRD